MDDRLLGEDHVVPHEAAGERREVAQRGQHGDRGRGQRVPGRDGAQRQWRRLRSVVPGAGGGGRGCGGRRRGARTGAGRSRRRSSCRRSRPPASRFPASGHCGYGPSCRALPRHERCRKGSYISSTVSWLACTAAILRVTTLRVSTARIASSSGPRCAGSEHEGAGQGSVRDGTPWPGAGHAAPPRRVRRGVGPGRWWRYRPPRPPAPG